MRRNVPRADGSSESKSSTWITKGEMVRICKCGLEADIKTCWSDDDPGKRFYVCSREKFGAWGGWKDWKDPKMCERSKHIILKFFRRINKLEEERAREKKAFEEIRAREKKVFKEMRDRERNMWNGMCWLG